MLISGKQAAANHFSGSLWLFCASHEEELSPQFSGIAKCWKLFPPLSSSPAQRKTLSDCYSLGYLWEQDWVFQSYGWTMYGFDFSCCRWALIGRTQKILGPLRVSNYLTMALSSDLTLGVMWEHCFFPLSSWSFHRINPSSGGGIVPSSGPF